MEDCRLADNYDKSSIDSILVYAQQAKNKKIADIVEGEEGDSRDKGAVGNLIQERYFGIPRNSSSAADFPEAQLELKCFGYNDKASGVSADQRLALTAIDFMEFQEEVPFCKSHLYNKCQNMLFMAYLLEAGTKRTDSEVKYVRLYEMDHIVNQDYVQIQKDYAIITDKIRNGYAGNLSEGDTEFLGAARTGDKNSQKKSAPGGIEALPRRFAFKKSYMTYLMKEYIVPERDFGKLPIKKKRDFVLQITPRSSFQKLLASVDKKYCGKAVKSIAKLKDVQKVLGRADFSQKQAFSRLGFAMLGIKSNKDPYLLKTNTVVKTVRISKKGKINESWSFPTFSIEEAPFQEWENSEVFEYLSEQRILMLLFKETESGYIYKGHLFLKFTPEQLEEGARQTWDDFRQKMIEGLTFKLKLSRDGKPQVQSNQQKKKAGQFGLIKLHSGKITYNIAAERITGDTDEEKRFIQEHTVDGRFILKPENRETCGCTLPNGDIITKQSYWLNNDYVLNYIRQEGAALLADEEQ